MNYFIAPKCFDDLAWAYDNDSKKIVLYAWEEKKRYLEAKGVRHQIVILAHNDRLSYIIYGTAYLGNNLSIRCDVVQNHKYFTREDEALRWLFNELEEFYEITSTNFHLESILKANNNCIF